MHGEPSHHLATPELDLDLDLTEENIPTTRKFQKDQFLSLKMIQTVAPVPDDFGAVKSITPLDEHSVTITDENNHSVEVSLDWTFVASQKSPQETDGHSPIP